MIYMYSPPMNIPKMKAKSSSNIVKETINQKAEHTTIFDYNVEIKDSHINGSMWLYRDARVLMDNVTFFMPNYAQIQLGDNAELIIKNSRIMPGIGFHYMNVFLYGSSRLVIEDTKILISSIYIHLYNTSAIYLNNTGNITVLSTYDETNATLYGSISSLYTVVLKNRSTLRIIDAEVDFGSSTIYANNDGIVIIKNSNYSGYIDLNHHAELEGYDSYINHITAFNQTRIIMNNCSGSNIDIRGETFLSMFGCNYTGSVNMQIYELRPERLIHLGPRGVINNTTIDSLYVRSFLVTEIFNSKIISVLEYTGVYTGYLYMDSHGKTYHSYYSNCEIIDSTIDWEQNLTDSYIFVANATEVVIENVSIDNAHLFNVSNATIRNVDYVSVNSWHTNLYVYDATNYFRVLSYEGNLSITDIIAYSRLWLEAKNVEVHMDNVFFNGTGSNIDMCCSFGNIHNVNISDVMIDIQYSNISLDLFNFTGADSMDIHSSTVHMINGSIDSKVNMYSSLAYLGNVSIDEIYIDKYHVENGSFTLNNSMISSPTGIIKYGIVDQGDNDISSISIENIYAYSAIINAYGILSETSTYGYLCIYLYDASEFSGYGVSTINTDAIIQVYNDSILSIYDGRFVGIYCYEGSLYLNNTIIIDDAIYLYDAKLNANYSEIRYIFVEGNADIWIYECNISEQVILDVDYLFMYALYGKNMVIPTVNVTILNSNVSEVLMVSYGNINITNSVVENVFYVFQHVEIKDTNITGILLNNTLFKSGDIIIENNNIVSGSGINLLSISGNCNIDQIASGIAVDEDPSGVNLSISNSMYFGVLTNGGYISIDASYLNIFMSFGSSIINVHSSTMNASIAGEMVYMILANSVDIRNTTILTYGLAYVASNVLLEDISGGISWILLRADSATISARNLYYPILVFEIFNSSVEISNVSVGNIYIDGGSCSIEASKVLSGVLISSNSMADINDSDINLIELYDIYDYPRNIALSVRNSNITDRYIVYYDITTYRGVIFNNDMISGEYNTTTNYINVNKEPTLRHVLFEVKDYGKIKIVNYTQYQIDMLLVNTTRDINPPIIESLNGTEIEYELGYNANIFVKLSDETPTKYEIYLNDSKIMNNTYGDMQIIPIPISDHTTNAGTYILEIDAYDSEGAKTTFQINVIVRPAEPPEITSEPQDSYTIYIRDTLNLEWVAIDAMPDTYTIYINGVPIINDTWTNGSPVSYIFTSNETGAFNVTIVFYDKIGQHASDTVTITVKKTTTLTNYLWQIAIPIIIIVVIVAILLLRKRKKSR